jgi:hypothetical protein
MTSLLTAPEGVMPGLRFEVPSDWARSANRYQRYHIGFVFCIPPSDLVGTFGIAASPVTISTNKVSGIDCRCGLSALGQRTDGQSVLGP